MVDEYKGIIFKNVYEMQHEINKNNINEDNKLSPKDNAELHYKYVESICHKMYVDAFIHGYKHGANNEKH